MGEILCKFKDIRERDMDMLFLEEMVSSNSFLNIFLKQIKLQGAKIIKIEHSKTDSEYGESDMTVIVECNKKRHGLLIENKIDAIAMPEQCLRYFKRGEQGVAFGEYDCFHVFIVAPKKYLDSNKEAEKYPHKIYYETFIAYFEEKNDLRSRFKLQKLRYAIEEQKNGYQVKVHRGVTEFWDKYIEYKKEKYPELLLVSSGGDKGAKATWPQYKTCIKGLSLFHKSEKGVVDLNFDAAADKIVLLESLLSEQLGDLKEQDFVVDFAGKSAVLRKQVPKLDFKQPFEVYAKELDICFEAIAEMSNLVKKLDAEQIRKLMMN